MLSSISGKNRFKLFKRAVKTKDRNTWADYKTLRNEITSDLRKGKAAYFRDHLQKGEDHLDVLECIIQSYQPQSKNEDRSFKAWRQQLGGKRHGEGEPYELFLLHDSWEIKCWATPSTTLNSWLVHAPYLYQVYPTLVYLTLILTGILHYCRIIKPPDRMVYHPNYWNSQVLLLLARWQAFSCKAYANEESTIIWKWPD